MTLLSIFLRGFVIGFSIAAPVGPIGVLVIRRTLANGRISGLLSGLGAATADGLYGCVAALGLTAISTFLVDQGSWLRLVGGLFLLYLGGRTLLAKAPPPVLETGEAASFSRPSTGSNGSLLADYSSTLLLTLTNPVTILSFAAIFAGLGLGETGGGARAGLLLVAGVFCGSALWWLILSAGADWLRQRFLRPGAMLWINRLSGAVIIAFGLAALSSLAPALLGQERAQAPGMQAAPAAAAPAPEGFQRADGPRAFTFPDDHGAHPDFQTEWWYFTGNLATADGRRFGYQFTIFRRALTPPVELPQRTSQWASNQVYMAHFAVSDVSSERYQAFERLARGAAGLAGAQAKPFEVWLEDWQVIEEAAAPDECPNPQSTPCALRLIAAQDGVAINLRLVDKKGPVLQGDQGYSRKGPEPGQASYYYSLTRLESQGEIRLGKAVFPVSGYSWMDHEFSTSALSIDQVGWDWFSIQLEDNSELMFFQIRRADGEIDPFSSGALIAPDGAITPLKREDFQIEVAKTWTSPRSQAIYPAGWRVRIPGIDMELDIQPLLADQELNVSYAYWEGAVTARARRAGVTLQGYGYVELTGYSGSMGGEF